jgi:NADPH2:quinone reductase
MKAVRIHAYGGPEQMRYEDVELGSPQPGEAFVKHAAIGVNFADLHNCQGRYPLPSLPHALGGEAAGIV